MPPVRKPAAKAATARAEVKATQRTFKFDGLTLKIPQKLPFRILKHLDTKGARADIEFLRELIGDEQLEKVWDLDLDIDRGIELVNQLTALYGFGDPGE